MKIIPVRLLTVVLIIVRSFVCLLPKLVISIIVKFSKVRVIVPKLKTLPLTRFSWPEEVSRKSYS